MSENKASSAGSAEMAAKAPYQMKSSLSPRYSAGTGNVRRADQWFAKIDGSGAVFLMNVTDPAEAHALLEKLPGAMIDVSTKATVLSAQMYVVARLAHYVIYAAGIPILRTLAFLVGACATLVIAVSQLFTPN